MSFSTSSQSPSASPLRRWLLGLAMAAGAWFLAYSQLTAFADAVVLALGLSRDTGLGEAVHFFVYDTPKVALLLVGCAPQPSPTPQPTATSAARAA